MDLLPPLTEKIPHGAPGGHLFEKLMHQLLFRYADQEHFRYEPMSSSGGDGGIDGRASDGLPGLDGPVCFQYKWLWGGISRGGKARQIKKALSSAEKNEDFRHWILVTPCELSPSEQKWLFSQPVRQNLTIHHWGQERIENLLRMCPPLFARYYPHEARVMLDGYSGFDFAEFSAKYRRKVALAHRTLRTLGLPPETLREREYRSDLRLRDIFVPVHLMPAEQGHSLLHLREVLQPARSMMVLGDPGTGKSTLLSFLALLYSGEADLPNVEYNSSLIPLLIPMRDFARLQQMRPDLSFIDYLEIRARSDFGLPNAHRAFFEAALLLGDAIVLLDGLDEVGNEASRRRVAHAVLAFSSDFPNCPFWVTSRIHGYTQDVRLPEEAFQHVKLSPLDADQIDLFIERWYALQLGDNERERKEQVASLRYAVLRTSSVRRLAGNPLLLTLMAFIHQGTRRLPQERGELYDKCIDMLLKTWQEAKWEESARAGGFTFEGLGLYLNTQKDYLAHLALNIQEQNELSRDDDGRSLMSRSRVLDCLAVRHLERSLRTRPAMTRVEAREEMEYFLEYISDQTGLLVDRGGGQISFIHLSFQEYLAAWVFTCGTGGADVNFFEKYLDVVSWEEVLLLRLYIVLRSPGGGGEEVFDGIISRVLLHLEAHHSQQGWLVLARSLRDNLDFSAQDQLAILIKLIELWLSRSEFSGDWFLALEEISRSSCKASSALASTLTDFIVQRDARHSIACLHLVEKLYGFPSNAATLLAKRSDLSLMRSDLAVFGDVDGLGRLFLENAGFKEWFAILSAADPSVGYRISLGWATGELKLSPMLGDANFYAAIAVMWRKILKVLTIYKTLVARHSREGLPLRLPPALEVIGQFHTVVVPLSCPSREMGKVRLPTCSSTDEKDGGLLQPKLGWQRLEVMSSGVRLEEKITNWLQDSIGEVLGTSSIGESLSDLWPWAARDLLVPLRRQVDSFIEANAASMFRLLVGRQLAFPFASLWLSSKPVLESLPTKWGRFFFRREGEKLTKPHFFSEFYRRICAYSTETGLVYFADIMFPLIVQSREVSGRGGYLRGLLDRLQLLSGGDQADILEEAGAWFWFEQSASVREKRGKKIAIPTFRVSDPLSMPLLLMDVYVAALASRMLLLQRYLSVEFPSGGASVRDIKSFLLDNPGEAYELALSWNQWSAEFSARVGQLKGPRGVLFLAHAAYAALVTGLPCGGSTWQSLLEQRDRGDELGQAGFLLYEACHFRRSRENMDRFLVLLDRMPRELGQLICERTAPLV